MKKETKQILLVFLMIVMVISVCALVIGCDSGKKPADETGLTLPGATTESSTTTTTNGINPPVTTTTTTTVKPTDTTTTTKPITPVETGTYTNPLTGLKTCSSNPSSKRPVAIVIDNISNAYANQKGIYQADILYEIPVAPGITRYMAIIEDYEKLSDICNIRSGRDYHLNIAATHNAILVCHGGSITQNYDFYALAAAKLGNRWGYIDTMFEHIFSWAGVGYSDTYGTIKPNSRLDLKYDTIVNGPALLAVFKNSFFKSKANGTTAGTPKGFVYSTSSTSSAVVQSSLVATEVGVKYTTSGASGTKSVNFRYDSASGKYIRYQDNKASGTGETLSFKNVIILGTTIKNASTGISSDKDMALVTTSGTGTGYYFCSGKAVKITWSQTGSNPVKFYAYGTTNEIPLTPGNTYVGYAESSFVTGAIFFA